MCYYNYQHCDVRDSICHCDPANRDGTATRVSQWVVDNDDDDVVVVVVVVRCVTTITSTVTSGTASVTVIPQTGTVLQPE